jgi:hypothetical protein
MIKRIASYILFLLMSAVLLVSGAYGNSGSEHIPTRKSLENISSVSAIAVIVLALAGVGGLVVLAIRYLVG